MEYFSSHGGNNRPYFAHRLKVKKMTAEAYEWCIAYPSTGYFQRFHVEWDSYDAGIGYEIVQFESERAAIMFALKFGDL
jgi:hypothetical protein